MNALPQRYLTFPKTGNIIGIACQITFLSNFTNYDMVSQLIDYLNFENIPYPGLKAIWAINQYFSFSATSS